jgi:hypothetical protein
MTHVFRHPKYWKEMRKLQAASAKPQAEESRPERPKVPSSKLQAASVKHQANINNHE